MVKKMQEVFIVTVILFLIAFIFGVIFESFHYYPTNRNIQQVVFATILGIIFSTSKFKVKNCGLISLVIGHGLNDGFIILLGYFLL